RDLLCCGPTAVLERDSHLVLVEPVRVVGPVHDAHLRVMANRPASAYDQPKPARCLRTVSCETPRVRPASRYEQPSSNSRRAIVSCSTVSATTPPRRRLLPPPPQPPPRGSHLVPVRHCRLPTLITHA